LTKEKSSTLLTINTKKTSQCRTVCNGDTAYITHLKPHSITFAAHRHNVNVLICNSKYVIFAVLVVRRVVVKNCF